MMWIGSNENPTWKCSDHCALGSGNIVIARKDIGTKKYAEVRFADLANRHGSPYELVDVKPSGRSSRQFLGMLGELILGLARRSGRVLGFAIVIAAVLRKPSRSSDI
jgi:hypothetical protein